MSRRAAAPPLPRLGALDRWRAEIRAGKRQNTVADFDDLHAAACNELYALECEAVGDHRAARYWLDTAILRLHGLYPDAAPDDVDEKDRKKPGRGRRLLNELRKQAGAA
jgi:hypothetical protein